MLPRVKGHVLVVGAALALGCANRSAPTEPEVAKPKGDSSVATPAEPLPEPEPEPAVTPKPNPTHVLEPNNPVRLDQDNELRVQSVVIESIEPSPDGAYPAGSGIDVEVVMQRGQYEVRGTMTSLSEGYTSRPIAWLEQYRVTLVDVADPHNAPKVSLLVERLSDGDATGEPHRGRLSKDTPITLSDGTELRFLGHSHKSVSAGMTSPLMISVAWAVPGYEAVDQHTSIETDGERTFEWHDHVVKVVEWQYDDWMDVEIRGRKLERVR